MLSCLWCVALSVHHPAANIREASVVCRYALVKVGTDDGKLRRLVTRSEARRVRQRIGDGVTSPGANGRSRRVSADPQEGIDTEPAPSAADGDAAAVSADLQAARTGIGHTGAGAAQPTPGAGIGPNADLLPPGAGSAAANSFSAQLNAALQAVHAAGALPAWVPACRPHTEPSPLLSQQADTGGPVVAALATVSSVKVDPEHLIGTAPPPLHHAAAAAVANGVPERKKRSRSQVKPAKVRQEAQLPTGVTSRGRVRQRGSKRAELICVGRLR